VLNGSGSGDYSAATEITLTSEAAPEGQVFASWQGQVGTVTVITE